MLKTIPGSISGPRVVRIIEGTPTACDKQRGTGDKS